MGAHTTLTSAKLKYFVFVMMIVLTSCGGKFVTFTEPQPVNSPNLKKFPERLQGEYIEGTDNSRLSISEFMMIKTAELEVKLHKNDLDSSVSLKGDILTDLTNNISVPVKWDRDSLIYQYTYKDTLFTLSEKNILRKLKGHYFLNRDLGGFGWEVEQMDYRKGRLSFSTISDSLAIKNLREIGETEEVYLSDSLKHEKMKVSHKEFKNFVSDKGFQESAVYRKVKK